MEEINIYCDESCHLEHDSSNIMILGAVWCNKNKVKEINQRIMSIKERNGFNRHEELKWTKIAKSNYQMYLDIIDYFFDDDDLHFRGYIANKEHLDHSGHNQTHDEWYYKIYFRMLEILFNRNDKYNIYVDIKDVHSHEKCQKLLKVCQNSNFDFDHNHILKIQPVRSDEVQLIQLTDLLIGAIGFYNRKDIPHKSDCKKSIIANIINRSRYNLKQNTYSTEKKFNIFFWGFENAFLLF